MTRTSIIAIALFSSACATDVADYEDTVSDAEAELEEIIRQLNDDDDEDESSSEKSGANGAPDNMNNDDDAVEKTVFEMALTEFKAELKECNAIRAIAGKYSPDKQTVHGYILDPLDMLTGEMYGKYTTNGNGAGPFKGAMMDHDLFADSASGPKVALEGAYEDLEIVAETCDGRSVAETCDGESVAEHCDGSSVAETCTGSSIAEYCDGSFVAETLEWGETNTGSSWGETNTGSSWGETNTGSSAYTVFLSLSDNVNDESTPMLGMIAICD